MVEGPNGVGPRGGRFIPNPHELTRRIEEGLIRARAELASGDSNEAAISFSVAARMCMEKAGLVSRAASVDWIERSLAPRMEAIKLFHQIGRTLDEARDHSFLGKAYSRLGVIKKDPRLLQHGVFERTLAHGLFRALRQEKAQGEELSYLADDFRALGWLENDPRFRSYLLLKASGYSEAAMRFYPRFLTGEELNERQLIENGFIAISRGGAALVEADRIEMESCRDRCRTIAEQLMRRGIDNMGIKLVDYARALDKKLVALSFEASP